MRRILLSVGVIVGLLALVMQSVQSQTEPAKPVAGAAAPGQKDGTAQPTPDYSADETAIRANVAQFAKAYNDRDAKAIAALFTPDGQIVDKDGNESAGRAAIEKTFAAGFAAAPTKRLEVSVESIRFLGKDLAVETGTTKEFPAPNEPPEFDRYTVIHVKREGKWAMALARDEEGPPPSAHEQLRVLAWLVGDWVDDGGSTVVNSTCRWSDDGHFLVQEFKVRISGRDAMTVRQRIGWDPLAKQIRSWVFDSEGGFGESLWTRDGDGWLIKSTGIRPDGTTASATNILTSGGGSSYIWRSTDRIVAGETRPAVEVKIIRKPPQPHKK